LGAYGLSLLAYIWPSMSTSKGRKIGALLEQAAHPEGIGVGVVGLVVDLGCVVEEGGELMMEEAP
jgi:hypothetical protein